MINRIKKLISFGAISCILVVNEGLITFASPYGICDDFNNYMKSTIPSFYNKGIFEEQGVNTYNYHGTCSEASEANVMNLIFGTDYTEQDFVDLAIKLGLCTVDSDNQFINGGQTPIQMANVLQYMGGTTGHPVKAEIKVTKDVPDSVSCASILSNDRKIIMAVDSNVLWNAVPSNNYFDSNHWIVVDSPIYENGVVVGYNIADSSGSHIRTVTSSKFDEMIFGPTKKEIPYCACVIVSKI